MTWLDLMRKIAALSPEQMQTDVTVNVVGREGIPTIAAQEYYGSVLMGISSTDDVLDKGHPYLMI